MIPAVSPIKALSQAFPWPKEVPSLGIVCQQPVRRTEQTTRLLAGALSSETRLVVQLGARSGSCSVFIAERPSGAAVVTIDQWETILATHGQPQRHSDLATAYDTFLSTCWPYRDRIIPLSMTPLEGLKTLATYSLLPDIVYMYSYDSPVDLLSILAFSRRLFPGAVLMGEEPSQSVLRGIVTDFARRNGLSVGIVGNGWRLWDSWLRGLAGSLFRSRDRVPRARKRLSPTSDTATGRARVDREAPLASSGCSLTGSPTQRLRVSLTMIVRNEEVNLPSCLASVDGLFHEIIVVDTGSVDRTKEIAERFGARVIEYDWSDDFSAARNAALDHANGEYVFWLDADEMIDEENRTRLSILLNQLGNDDAIYMMRQQSRQGPGAISDGVVDQVRLFPNRKQARWSGRLHEQIISSFWGRTELRWTDIAIRHSGYAYPDTVQLKLHRNMRIVAKQ